MITLMASLVLRFRSEWWIIDNSLEEPKVNYSSNNTGQTITGPFHKIRIKKKNLEPYQINQNVVLSKWCQC